MDHQDWTPIVIGRNKKPTLKRDGTTEVREKRHVDQHARKLDKADEAQKLETVPKKIALLIQQARISKKWSQKDLAMRLNVQQSIVNDIESGKAILDKQVLAKMQRVLGVKL